MCLCVCGPRAKSCWETSNTSLRLCCKWEKLITCSYLITALSGSHNVAAFSFSLLFNILVILLLCAKLSLTKFMSNLTCVCVEIWMTTGALKGATVQMVCKMCVYFCRCTKYNTLNMCMSHHSGQLATRPRNKPTATVWLPVTPHVVSMCVTLEIAALSRTGKYKRTHWWILDLRSLCLSSWGSLSFLPQVSYSTRWRIREDYTGSCQFRDLNLWSMYMFSDVWWFKQTWINWPKVATSLKTEPIFFFAQHFIISNIIE